MLFRNHALVAAMAALCTMFCAMPAHAEDEDAPRVMSAQEYAAAAGIPPVFTVIKEDHHDTLPSLRNAVVPSNGYGKLTHFEGLIPLPPGSTNQTDGAVQSMALPTRNTPATINNFDGVGNGFTGPNGTFTVNSIPPDTDGAVGATQYVSLVNTGFAVFDKTTGNAVYGPVPTSTLWSGFGGGCESNNDGDGVVIYDRAAGRWVISQFSVSSTPFLQCVAVSQTSDATGGWYRYSFNYGSTNFPDYPKMGSWPDAYYETFNVFGNGGNGSFSGANLCAYDRTNMLAGNAATQQCFQLSSAYGGVLPSDLDGSTPPPANSPNYLINYGTNSLHLWKFHVDWATPANSTLTGPTNIAVPAFSALCGGGTCITQPGTTQKLDSLADRMMFRLAYRNFGNHEALVASHSVTAGTKGGVRWYELRNPNGAVTVNQASTYAPDTTSYRWMPSIAMDHVGNIALGYSVSTGTSPTISPSVRYTGRVPTDPLNSMEAEVHLFSGTGSQIGTCGSPPGPCTRWGDYSAMTVDPVDDCTFWYTNEYLPANGLFNWKTRIGSFRFPGCFGPPAKLAFTVEPNGSYQSNAPITVKVSVEDTNGNVVTTDNSNVTIALAGGTLGANLAGTLTAQAVNGVATFSGLSVDKAGAGYTLHATDASLTPADSSAFAIVAGAATTISFTTQPVTNANITAGSPITLVAHVVDGAGNVVAGASVALAIASGFTGSTLTATTPQITSASGDATFSNVSLNKVGTGTLSATDGALSATSNSFNIVAASADHLTFTPVPGDIVQGQTLGTVTVTEYDAFDNQVTSDSTTQVSLVAGSCSGTALGTQALAGGVVTFATTQTFMTVASGVNLSAAAGASPPTAAASTFNVAANGDFVFRDGFDGCRP